MPATPNAPLDRITVNADVRFGKACIRGHWITVQEILEWLSNAASQEQILSDYPQLEPEDFLAVCAYAANLSAHNKDSAQLSELFLIDSKLIQYPVKEGRTNLASP